MAGREARGRADVLLVRQMDNSRMLVASQARQRLLRDARRALRHLLRPRLVPRAGVGAASEALMVALGLWRLLYARSWI